MNRLIGLAVAVVILVCPSAPAEPPASQPARRKIDPELMTIYREYEKARNDWGEEQKRITETQGHYAKLPPLPSEVFVPRLKEYIARNAGTQSAVDGFRVILDGANRIQSVGETDEGAHWAITEATRTYAKLPEVKGLLTYAEPGLVQVSRGVRFAFAKSVIEGNQDRETVAEAKRVLAENLLKAEPQSKPPYEPSTSERSEGQRLLRELAKDYSDTSAGQQAGRQLFELDHLQVGMTAPDFSATTVDGQEISMAGLRGRVVVLVFWGVGSDMKGIRIPVSSDVVEKFKDKPVTFLGMSADGAVEKTRDTIQKEHAAFPNIVDGRERKIIRLWNVSRWPSIHIVDDQGVIRHKQVGAEKVEALLNELLEQGHSTKSDETGP